MNFMTMLLIIEWANSRNSNTGGSWFAQGKYQRESHTPAFAFLPTKSLKIWHFIFQIITIKNWDKTRINSHGWKPLRLVQRIFSEANHFRSISHYLSFQVTSQRPCWCTEQSWKKSFENLMLLLCKTWATFCHCFVHQHGRLITWAKPNYKQF